MKTKLEYITPDLAIETPVAIVGSSGWNAALEGAEIDAFPSVCRFNRAPTKGYEDLVGARTTIRMINEKVWLYSDGFIVSFNGFPVSILVFTLSSIDKYLAEVHSGENQFTDGSIGEEGHFIRMKGDLEDPHFVLVPVLGNGSLGLNELELLFGIVG